MKFFGIVRDDISDLRKGQMLEFHRISNNYLAYYKNGVEEIIYKDWISECVFGLFYLE